MKRLGVLVLAFVTVLAISCGGGGTTGDTPDDTKSLENVLRVVGPDPLTMDPATTSDAGSATYIEEIFGGLLTLELDKDGNVVMAPDLAEVIPTVENGGVVKNPDGTVSYTFKIRLNAAFHSGKKVTAHDVKYSFERAADPQTRSSTAELYLGDIVGAMDKIRGRTQEISGVRVLDPQTLEVSIDGPKVYFLWKLTYPTAFVVDSTQVESNPRNWTRRPNGTGPFTLAKWDLGREIVLERNPNYHLGAPKLERVEFFLSGGSSLTMYEVGDVDIAGVGTSDIDRVRDPNDPLSKEFLETPGMDVFYVGFNTEKAPFDDPKVRQAFAQAIDKEQIVEVVLKDEVVVARGILPPGMPGHRPDFKGLEFNPEKARALLRESRYGSAEGLGRITFTISGQGATAGPYIEAVIEMWRQNLGVDVEIEQIEFATFLEDVKRGKLQMFSLGWIADYPDPEDFLDLKFHSGRSFANNEARYRNPEVDRLLEAARVETDHAKRMQLYQQAEDIIVTEAPWVVLTHSKNNVVVKPYVKGYTPAPMVVPILRFVSIEK